MASDQGAISAMAPWAGVEPATFRLTVERSTAELPGNAAIIDSGGAITKAYRRCKAAHDAKAAFRRSTEGAKVGGHARN